MKREGNVWIRIFPDKPITKKPAEVRMGKGKGNPEYWAAVVQPGRILFEAMVFQCRLLKKLSAGSTKITYCNKVCGKQEIMKLNKY